jgi:hypothetical protein
MPRPLNSLQTLWQEQFHNETLHSVSPFRVNIQNKLPVALETGEARTESDKGSVYLTKLLDWMSRTSLSLEAIFSDM